MSVLRFLTSPVPASIAHAVREMWLLEDDGGFHAGLPKPYVELVISLAGVHWWRAAPASSEHRYVRGWVTPIQQGPRYARAVGRRRLIGARLEPWAALALFGRLPPGDGTPPPILRDLIGGEANRLRISLMEATNDDERFSRMASWLEKRGELDRSVSPGGSRLPRHANVAALAQMLRTSPRTLRRRFEVELGISPKAWLKLHRLDAVLRELNQATPRHSLAQVASAHGYADQAHFSREISRLTGGTPGLLRRRSERSPPHLLPGS